MLTKFSIIPLLFIGIFLMLSNGCKKHHEENTPIKLPDTVLIIDPVLNIEMVFVQGGTFLMGSTASQDYATPVHSVTLSDFYIGKFEVTQAQWKAIIGTNPSYYKGDNKPVENVSWNDLRDFVHKLKLKTGKKYRLITEAEWEYAARGGNKSKRLTYAGSNILNDVAWFSDNSGDSTHAVGTKRPNELGIYDMIGNVWEWCGDGYGQYSSNAQTDPIGPPYSGLRVYRGGGCSIRAELCRIAYRSGGQLGENDKCLGFRIACSKKIVTNSNPSL